jgi:hypothetical protein
VLTVNKARRRVNDAVWEAYQDLEDQD